MSGIRVNLVALCPGFVKITIHLTKTAAAQNEVALGYRSVRGLYFLAVVFERSILAGF